MHVCTAPPSTHSHNTHTHHPLTPTPTHTAMSFPATGMEKAYRNNLHDVAKMLKTKHEENYMVTLYTWRIILKYT